MLTFFITVGSIGLVFLCAWLVLLILMQKPSANAGMGAALGGGAAESAFGGEASNVLTRWTVYGVVAFFLLTLSLTLAQVYRHHHGQQIEELAPVVEQETEPQSLTQLPEMGKNQTVENAPAAAEYGAVAQVPMPMESEGDKKNSGEELELNGVKPEVMPMEADHSHPTPAAE